MVSRLFSSLTKGLDRALTDSRPTSPERKQPAAAKCLHQTHHAHVPIAEKEKKQKRNRPPHVHAQRIGNRQQKVNRKAQLQQRQPAMLALVLFPLPGFVASFFDAVLGRAHKLGLYARQGFYYSARI